MTLYDCESSQNYITIRKFHCLQFCQCSGNYSGYDCSRCKFGYYGESCDQFQVLPRRPIATYSDDEWAEFIDILIRSRQFESDYHVVLEETVPGNVSLRTSNVTLYKLYVWMHHYAAKDGNTLGLCAWVCVTVCVCMRRCACFCVCAIGQ